MSSESETTGLRRDRSPFSIPIQLKPEPLNIEPIWEDAITEESRQILLRECYKGHEDYINQSPYDATNPPPELVGGNPVRPFEITGDMVPILKQLSELALKYYYDKEGASFEFHDLVKYARWSEFGRMAAYTRRRPPPMEHYITFQAKAKGDTSSRPAITTFQAKILEREDARKRSEIPVVEECHIKSTM